MKNKYNNLSWGYLFDLLDKKANNEAIKVIGDCAITSAQIDYFKPLRELDTLAVYTEVLLFWEPNKCKVVTRINNNVFATFTFIKLK
jgi:hypothetical protein